MTAHVFKFSTPSTLSEALGLLSDGAMPLAGGQSLIPMMKFQLAAPKHLVDLSRISELNHIIEEGNCIRIGAMVTHFQIEASQHLKSKCSLLPDTAARIGDVQVRNLGTIGGTIAHADPSADYPATLLALDAKVRVATASSQRTVSVEEIFVDAFTTTLKQGEAIVEIIVPVEEAGTRCAYEKVIHPASGFASVGVAVRARKSEGRVEFARIGVTGLAHKPFRARYAEELLEGTVDPDLSHVAAAVTHGIRVASDQSATAAQKKHLAEIHTARALKQVLG